MAERVSPVPPTRLAVPPLNSVDGSSVMASRVVSPHPASFSLTPSSCVAAEDSTVPRHLKASHSSSSSSYASTLAPSESDSSQEVNSSGYHSLNPQSASPTPPSSPNPPHSSHPLQPPIQPVSVHRTKNRLQIKQMMSSVRMSPSPSKDPLAHSNLTRSRLSEPHHPISLVDSSSLTANAYPPPAGTQHLSSLSPPPSSRSANIQVCVTMDTSNSISNRSLVPVHNSQWTSVETDVCVSDFAALQSVTEGTELNGCRDKDSLDVVKFTRKRPRSYSPISLNRSTPSPRHKMHKPHKHSSVLDKHEQFIVRLPLDRVSLNTLQPPSLETTMGSGLDTLDIIPSPARHVEEVCELVVSYQLSLLRRTPLVVSSPLETGETSFQTNSSLTSHQPQSLFLPPSILHSKVNHHADTDTELSNETEQSSLRPPKQERICHPPSSSKAEETRESSMCICPSPRDIPPDVCPGVHGCVGKDGHWYTWTDHIHSCGPEVTILPYVYIDF